MKTYAASVISNVSNVNQLVSLPAQPLSGIKLIAKDAVNQEFRSKAIDDQGRSFMA